jgi:hypothetical protein
LEGRCRPRVVHFSGANSSPAAVRPVNSPLPEGEPNETGRPHKDVTMAVDFLRSFGWVGVGIGLVLVLTAVELLLRTVVARLGTPQR